jgi:hypothetical protein
MEAPEARPAKISAKEFARCQNVLGNHWLLLWFDLHDMKVYLYDSKRGHDPSSRMQQVVAGIGTAVWEGSALEYIEHWSATVLVDVPQQPNDHDCGICMVIAALHVIANTDFPDETVPTYTQLWRLLYQATECVDGYTQAVAHLADVLKFYDTPSSNPVGIQMMRQDLRAIQKLAEKVHAGIQERRQRQNNCAHQLATTIHSHRNVLRVQHDMLRRAGHTSEDLDRQSEASTMHAKTAHSPRGERRDDPALAGHGVAIHCTGEPATYGIANGRTCEGVNDRKSARRTDSRTENCNTRHNHPRPECALTQMSKYRLLKRVCGRREI